jgi:hypothetical protein
MMPLKILLVDHAPIVGGVEMMIWDLLISLNPAAAAAWQSKHPLCTRR